MVLLLKHLWAALMLALTFSANVCAANDKHVLLISIDGLRWDYLQEHQPAGLQAIAKRGAVVEQLLPAFPSNTFPNHLTLATGLYPEHHGIVANRFVQPDLNREYNKRDSDSVTDGRFYGGVPIWSLAEQQGITSAVYFWPGSEAEIAGQRPSYVKRYRPSDSHHKRITQVIDWFQLAAEQRPRLVMLYFSAVDSAGHNYGPLHRKTKRALEDVDLYIDRLLAELGQLPFDVDVIITGDHGMRDSASLPKVHVDRRLARTPSLRRDFRILGSGSLVQFYYRGRGDKQQAIGRLAVALGGTSDSAFYPRNAIPSALHFSDSNAVGDGILVSHSHYLTYSDAAVPPKGVHGYDANTDVQMRTLLLADGPSFGGGRVIEQAESIHLYPLIAHLLGLEISEPIDGRLAVLAPLLNDSR